jgi:hypothetical protein
MRNADSSTKVIALRVTVFTGIGVLVAGLIAAAALIATPQNAQATPQYAAKEGKACGYCHVNPAGGGPRNAKGKQYEANGHKFK